MTFTILSLTAAYALVAALVAYLLVLTRLHWVLKAAATIATVALIVMTFFGIGELRGLPSDGPLPISFRMLWATHLLEEVEGADRIVLLIKGEVKADDTPAALMQMAQAADLTQAYITLTAAKAP